MCRLKSNKKFAELANLSEDELAQINRFIDKNNNKTELNIAQVAEYLGFVTKSQKNTLLNKEAHQKIDSASKDFTDIVEGKLKKEDMPEMDFGADGGVYPANPTNEVTKGITATADLTEAMVLLYEPKGDVVHDAMYNAVVLKGLDAAERLYAGYEKGRRIDPQDKESLYNGFTAVVEHMSDEDNKELANEFLANRKKEMKNFGGARRGRTTQNQASQPTR